MSIKKNLEINLEGDFANSFVKIDGESFPVTGIEIKYQTGDVPRVTLTFPVRRVKGMIKEGKLKFAKGVV